MFSHVLLDGVNCKQPSFAELAEAISNQNILSEHFVFDCYKRTHRFSMSWNTFWRTRKLVMEFKFKGKLGCACVRLQLFLAKAVNLS